MDNSKSILGITDIDKLVVQKSLPLFSLWHSNLTLAEFKILDAYLSRINSHNPEQRRVCFDKGELETLLGVDRIRNTDLENRLEHLMKSVVKITDGTEKKGFKLITLFEEAEAIQDESTGLWSINLECSTRAMKYFFNIENLGYLRYKLRCITEITSRYTYILFVYLEANRYRKSWEISLDELRKILNCEDDSTYTEYKFFNHRILKKCHTELHEKTPCRFSYEPVKRGRTVVAVRFTIETIKDIMPVDNQLTLEAATEPQDYSNDTIGFYAEACDNLFTETEMELILTAVRTKDLPTHQMGVEFARYQYLELKYRELKRQIELKRNRGESPIKDLCSYLVRMIEKG